MSDSVKKRVIRALHISSESNALTKLEFKHLLDSDRELTLLEMRLIATILELQRIIETKEFFRDDKS